MDVSFIIPIYNNSGKDLEQLIKSVKLLDATINYEIILIDDGSNKELSTEYRKISLNYNVNYFRKRNAGVSSARNYGLKKSKGKYIVFLDADDQFVASNFSLFHEEKDLTIYNIERLNIEDNKKIILDIDSKDKKLNASTLLPYLLRDNVFNFVTGKVYLRKFLIENKIEFNPNITVGEDLDFVSKVLLLKPSIRYVPKVLYKYLFKIETGKIRIEKHPLQNLQDAVHVYKLRKDILKKVNLTNTAISSPNLNDSLIDDVFEIYSQYLNNDLKDAIGNKKIFVNVIEKYSYHLNKKSKFKSKLIKEGKYRIIGMYLKARYFYKKLKL